MLHRLAFDPDQHVLVLELAQTTLLTHMERGRIERGEVITICKAILHAVELLHSRYIHLDIKPANVVCVVDSSRGMPRVEWKLADFDGCAKAGTRGAGFSSHYCAPEIARCALAKTPLPPASEKMDIFSVGLVCFEMATGSKMIEGSEKQALEWLAASHKALHMKMDNTLGVIDPTMQAFLRSLLAVEPDARKPAERLLKDTLLTGDWSTSMHRQVEGRVIAKVESAANRLSNEMSEGQKRVTDQVLAALAASTARLSKEVGEGNRVLLRQMQRMNAQLGPLRCEVAQQVLEMRSVLADAGGADPAELSAIQERLQASMERTMQEMTAIDAGAVKEMAEELVALQPNPDHAADAMLKALEVLMSKVDEMSGQMSQLSAKVDEVSATQAEQLALLNSKIDTLLTDAHEQPFRYFLLVPKPTKGWRGKALSRMNPKNWFTKPMLLVPLYRRADGGMTAAPGLPGAQFEGFDVNEPRVPPRRRAAALPLRCRESDH